MATFDAAVGRGLADEREARRAAGEAALARAVVGAVAPAVSVAQFTAAGRADGARAEDVRERPGDVFVICEAVAALADGVAEALGAPRSMVADGHRQASRPVRTFASSVPSAPWARR